MTFKKSTMSSFIVSLLLLCNFSAKADLSKDAEPGSIVTCQPNSSTPFTASFTVGKGPGCNNLSAVGNVTFIWEYFDGSSWITVANNTPSGFTYTNSSVRTGAGSGAQITNTLTVTLSSSASIGIFSFRCRANQPTGCSNFVTSNTITVTVNAKPTPAFTTQPGANACINSLVTYTTQSSQSAYAWFIPGVSGSDYTITGGSVSSNTVTLQWLTTGSKTVTINYTNSNGCTAALPTSSTATTVNALPSPGFTAQPSGTICAFTNVTYTTQSGQSNYIWTLPGVSGTDYSIISGSIGTGSNTVTLQWLTPGSKVVTINYTNAASCTASLPTSSNSITVTARPTPIFIASPAANVCAGVDIIYTAQPGQSNYTWVVPGTLGTDYTITSGGIGTDSNTVTLKWLTAGSKTVTVNYTNAAGCAGLTVASSSATVNMATTPTITPASSTTFCAGGSVVLTASPGSVYQWYNNGTLIPTATSINYTASSQASYTVKVTDAIGCDATSSATAVTVNPLPSVNLDAQAASVCFSPISQTTTLNYTNAVNSPINYSITWDAAAITAGFTDVTNAILPVTPINISVPAGSAFNTYTGTLTVTNANTCTSTAKTFTVTVLAPPDVSNFIISAPDVCEGTGSTVTVSSTTLINGI